MTAASAESETWVPYKKETDPNPCPCSLVVKSTVHIAAAILFLLVLPLLNKFNMAFLIFLICLFVSVAHAQRFVPGYCPAPVPQESFDKSKVSPVQTLYRSL
jgi:hypothetical protein